MNPIFEYAVVASDLAIYVNAIVRRPIETAAAANMAASERSMVLRNAKH